MEQVIEILKIIAERRAFYDDKDWQPEPSNADDIYQQGCNDGEIDLARSMLSKLNVTYIIN